jgi:hypothetical protein
MTSWVDFAYTIVALIVAALLMYVMQKVEEDRWSKTDPLWLQWMRRLAFCSTALILLYSVNSSDWKFTSLLLISGAAVILFINALALHLRAPPARGHRGRAYHPQSFSRFIIRVAHYFNVHR